MQAKIWHPRLDCRDFHMENFPYLNAATFFSSALIWASSSLYVLVR